MSGPSEGIVDQHPSTLEYGLDVVQGLPLDMLGESEAAASEIPLILSSRDRALRPVPFCLALSRRS